MESIPVRRSIHEKIENALYGHYGERAPLLGATAGAIVGAAVGSLPIALGAGTALGIGGFIFGYKMFYGIGVDPDDGHEVKIKRSLNEKIDNFFYGLRGQRGAIVGGLENLGEGLLGAIAGGIGRQLEHGKVLRGSAPSA